MTGVEREAMLRTVDLLERVNKLRLEQGDTVAMIVTLDYLSEQYDTDGPQMFSLVLYNLVISELALMEKILPVTASQHKTVASYLEETRQRALDLAVVEGDGKGEGEG